jgi:hypothetical protein
MYTVLWKKTALDQLTELWLAAPNRAEINAAVEEIDRLLSADPHHAGKSRTATIRVIFCQPLGAFFEIVDDDRKVNVLRVWTF